jgi:hypothetical protein
VDPSLALRMTISVMPNDVKQRRERRLSRDHDAE